MLRVVKNVESYSPCRGVYFATCVWALAPLWDCGTLVICISFPCLSSATGQNVGQWE